MAGPYTPDPNDPTRPYNSDEVQYGAEEIRKMKLQGLGPLLWRGVSATNYTAVTADLQNGIFMINGGVISIPLNFGPGIIGITGRAGTQIIAGDPGVTVRTPDSLAPQLDEDYSYAIMTRIAANQWLLAGNLMLVAP